MIHFVSPFQVIAVIMSRMRPKNHEINSEAGGCGGSKSSCREQCLIRVALALSGLQKLSSGKRGPVYSIGCYRPNGP
eukprot:scaffold512628_cov29-Prasinocladus_malaysianus.AAC.1